MKTVADALLTTEGTRARTAKVAALATALSDVATREPARLPFVARFLTGTLLPTEDDRTLGVGGALVFEAACNVTGATPSELGSMARRTGDLGTAVGEAMARRREREAAAGAPPATGLRLEDAETCVRVLVESNTRGDKLRALADALAVCSAPEARYLVRAVLGEMRVGAREGIVEDAIAKAFGRPLADVRNAHGLIADVGELARLAHEDRLGEARITVGRPVGFMLATPIETARGADLDVPHSIEDKIDGIRAQAHVAPGGISLFARGKGPVTAAFPDVTGPLLEAARSGSLPTAILDGEIVVVGADGRPRPFSAIQPRLKKTTPDEDLVRDHPVHYLVYDLLFEGEENLLALPFLERRARLVKWAENAPAPVMVHASRPLLVPPSTSEQTPEDRKAATTAVLDAEYDAARARGFEGLVLKRLDAAYAAGVRGFAWLKVKKALATLDVVVVGAEYGHGKRAGVLSDYTFAVRRGDELLTIGKAYSGLTDAEIATMTARLLDLAIDDADKARGQRRGWIPVRPEIVLEVAFDGLQRSDRHSSGFALRFPRIARIREDKRPEDADTLEDVTELWNAQLASGHREDLVAKDRKTGPKPQGRRSGRRPDVRQKSKQLRLFDDETLGAGSRGSAGGGTRDE
jgi:DNA ligase 1